MMCEYTTHVEPKESKENTEAAGAAEPPVAPTEETGWWFSVGGGRPPAFEPGGARSPPPPAVLSLRVPYIVTASQRQERGEGDTTHRLVSDLHRDLLSRLKAEVLRGACRRLYAQGRLVFALQFTVSKY